MGRKPTEAIEQAKPVIDGEAMMETFNRQVTLYEAQQAEVAGLAKSLNYEGALTVGGLEDEIRFYQRRSVEAVFELGKRLRILKRATAHGEFIESLERLGIDRMVAARFMAANERFSNVPSTAHLSGLPGMSQTKLLELLVLDDSEIATLSEGGTVRGVKLDDVECMTVRELRTALRKAKREQEEEKAAQAEMTRRRDERINKLEEENARLTALPTVERTPAMEEEERLRLVSEHGLFLVREIEVGLRSHFSVLERQFGDGVLPNHVRLAQQQAVSQVIQAARVLAGDFGITLKLEDYEPQELAWLTQSRELFGDADDPMPGGLIADTSATGE